MLGHEVGEIGGTYINIYDLRIFYSVIRELISLLSAGKSSIIRP